MENLDNKENNENLNIEQIEKPKKKKNITEEHRTKLRESMNKALAARKQKILERKELVGGFKYTT